MAILAPLREQVAKGSVTIYWFIDSCGDRGAFAPFDTDFRGTHSKNIAPEDFCDLIMGFVEKQGVPFAPFDT